MRSPVIAAILMLLAGGPAWAQNATRTEEPMIWRAGNDCARRAHRQYPEYTRESNLKRDRALRVCLAAGSLPPREDVAAPTDTQKR